ncbi:uncharacterized protein NEMAJ01_2364, partial [Nematocida major]|uniref:uncharacterized protein n=1 Tax=Nematocida major TaxID=1912982 RepID=UPI002007AEA1
LQNQLLFTMTFCLAIVALVFVPLFIVTSPRAILYEVQGPESGPSEEGESALENYSARTVTESTWYEKLYDFSIIRTDDDVTSKNTNIAFFTSISVDTEVKSLLQLSPSPLQSNRSYEVFQNLPEVPPVFFAESSTPALQYTIRADNLNLRNRQTAVCIFYADPSESALRGYVLNNITMRARKTTEIILLLDEERDFVRLIDLDGNSLSISEE